MADDVFIRNDIRLTDKQNCPTQPKCGSLDEFLGGKLKLQDCVRPFVQKQQ